MIASPSRPGRRGRVRRAVVLLPNGFTLLNLFCGIHAIVLASRGQFSAAVWFIVLGGVADVLDGRVARFTGTGSRLGEELDSLVDAISFGVAPAMIVYFAVMNHENWEWLLVFLFSACAVMRLARFNIEQAGRAKTHFHGLPSPAAGLTLASYFWFSQTPLYNQAVILFTDSTTLADLPWQRLMKVLMAILAFLMVTDVPYPAVPAVGLRTKRQRIGTVVVLGTLIGVFVIPKEFIFPALVVYVLFGLLRAATLGFVERRRTSPEGVYFPEEPDDERRVTGSVALGRPPAHVVDPDMDDEDDDELPSASSPAGDTRPRRKRRRRRPRGGPPGPSSPTTPRAPSE